MIINQDNCIFLIIDVQEKLLNAVFNKEILEKNAKILAKAAKTLEIPVFITEQYPQGLGKSIDVINEFSNLYIKTDFNALADKNLFNEIKKLGKKQVIVFGIETHICVYQSVIALLEAGFEVSVVSDASGSRSEKEYNAAFELMKNSGAQIKTTEIVLFEILKSAKHPNFKEIQTLIK